MISLDPQKLVEATCKGAGVPLHPVLALDLATKTGWSVRRPDGAVESGVQDFSLKRGESPGMRYLRFGIWVQDMICHARQWDYPLDALVVYELPHMRGGHATTVLIGLETRTQEACARLSLGPGNAAVDFASVQTATLKKFATGKGNASKAEMIEAAKPLLGRDPIDDNEADARHILEYAVRVTLAEQCA